MNKSESIKEITKAIVSVMKAVKGIDKSLTVGSGNASYKGVSDQDVKKEIGAAMVNNGLAIVPISVEPAVQIERWTEETNYGPKQKQQVFVESKTKYLLIHESGEWVELSGYGHGVDSQDKAAGKATTYALKYALLYTFMVPTGKIDDADAVHSDDLDTKKQQPAPQTTTTPQPAPTTSAAENTKEKPWLNEKTEAFTKAIFALKDGSVTIPQIEKKYRLSKQIRGILEAATEKAPA